jgi:hypothetical protein
MTYREFVAGVKEAVKAGDLKPIWLRAVRSPDLKRAVMAVLRNPT